MVPRGSILKCKGAIKERLETLAGFELSSLKGSDLVCVFDGKTGRTGERFWGSGMKVWATAAYLSYWNKFSFDSRSKAPKVPDIVWSVVHWEIVLMFWFVCSIWLCQMEIRASLRSVDLSLQVTWFCATCLVKLGASPVVLKHCHGKWYGGSIVMCYPCHLVARTRTQGWSAVVEIEGLHVRRLQLCLARGSGGGSHGRSIRC